MFLRDRIIAGLTRVTSSDNTFTDVWVQGYEPVGKDIHQMVLFLKPEVTSVKSGIRVDQVIDLTLSTLDNFGVEIGALRVVSGEYLQKHNLMEEHYGVISSISKKGFPVLSTQAVENFKQKFKDERTDCVLGAHQFLEHAPFFNPQSLKALNDNLGTVRLAGGTYAMKAKIAGCSTIILNPFHPLQLVPYSKKEDSIILFEIRSRLPWSELRQKLIGVTNPQNAEEGSLRNLFLKKKTKFQLPIVDMSNNGVHGSAGPLEAMVEISRFFSKHEVGLTLDYSETSFGKLLSDKGNLTSEQIFHLASNPEVEGISTFDSTEEKNSDEACEILSKMTRK